MTNVQKLKRKICENWHKYSIQAINISNILTIQKHIIHNVPKQTKLPKNETRRIILKPQYYSKTSLSHEQNNFILKI